MGKIMIEIGEEVDALIFKDILEKKDGHLPVYRTGKCVYLGLHNLIVEGNIINFANTGRNSVFVKQHLAIKILTEQGDIRYIKTRPFVETPYSYEPAFDPKDLPIESEVKIKITSAKELIAWSQFL